MLTTDGLASGRGASTTARRAGRSGSIARRATGGGTAARSGIPPGRKQAKPRSPRYLSEQERIRIADLLAAKVTVRAIALELGRAPSTISREIRRKSDPDGRYRPHLAEQSARLRACQPRKRHIPLDRCWARRDASAGQAVEPRAGRA
ncbi:MAG: helix-turn-helix domain-containing protein [Actinobacteria bacterium]|nr:helix-turn-helix domain-containing protein [Actinomycetota bacterium]MCA1701275.1 helix-turn-helix domain-containing protein [Actinomycetota bacterium]